MSYSGIGIVFNDPIIILHAFLNVNTGFAAKIFYPELTAGFASEAFATRSGAASDGSVPPLSISERSD